MPFSGNGAAIFNVESVFSTINTAASTPSYWCVTVLVCRNVCTQHSSDHKACDPENVRNHWNLVPPHVFPTVQFHKHVAPQNPKLLQLAAQQTPHPSCLHESSSPCFHLCPPFTAPLDLQYFTTSTCFVLWFVYPEGLEFFLLIFKGQS